MLNELGRRKISPELCCADGFWCGKNGGASEGNVSRTTGEGFAASRSAPAGECPFYRVLAGVMRIRRVLIAAVLLALCLPLGTRADGPLPLQFGSFPAGRYDGITDVAGVRVGHLTLVEGASIRTGATAILPDSDPWNHKVSAAALAFNGNGEMTGTHWVNEAGFLETPIVLTDTLDIGRADDGVISWMMKRYPNIGVTDDVPLPVVAECDDQLLNDIRARAVTAHDVVSLIDRAAPGQFARGSVGAGTGMKAFGFKAGIGSASRVLPASLGGYTVGVLVNDNTGATRGQLHILGVPVGQRMLHVALPKYPAHLALHGRMNSGSIVIIVATNAPLDSRELHEMTLRAGLGMGRTGLTSDVGSGDLFLAFSTGYTFMRTGNFHVVPPSVPILESDDIRDALFRATAEATEAAIYDALFSATTMTGRNGATVYALPRDRTLAMLRAAGAIR